MNAGQIVILALSLCAAVQATTVCAADMTDAELNAATMAVIKNGFHDKGIARLDRLKQDEVQALCTQYRDNPPVKDKERLQAAQEKTIKWPADGKYLGDWKAGEKLAQSGVGLTWKDKPGTPAGGGCYNCHQLSAKEIAYGTIGPSLLHYGSKWGPDTGQAQRRAYGHIYNSKAYNLCSKMPRFGHNNILTEAQIKDLVALLFDPESPVNKP